MASTSTGWTAFLGATIFEIGSIFGMWEAWNRDDTVRFGWSVSHALHRSSTLEQNGKNMEPKNINNEEEQKPPPRRWVWFSLDTQYFHEMGFLAAFFQLCAASVFWISGQVLFIVDGVMWELMWAGLQLFLKSKRQSCQRQGFWMVYFGCLKSLVVQDLSLARMSHSLSNYCDTHKSK